MAGRGLGDQVRGKSGDTGERYLPRKAREAISDEDYRRTSAKKRADTGEGRQFSKQPRDVAAKVAEYRHGSGPSARTRAELYEMAKRRGIPGRSTMSKAELERALA